ncbi:YfhE family protein [Bacillus fonticola]|nr:YfhE family protein [Bacillus fonticola]
MADKKKRQDRTKSTLSNTQEVRYAREFKAADRAGGYTSKRSNH